MLGSAAPGSVIPRRPGKCMSDWNRRRTVRRTATDADRARRPSCSSYAGHACPAGGSGNADSAGLAGSSGNSGHVFAWRF